HRREAGPKTRRYFVDACHPVWGLELLYCCWLPVGQRYYVGVGNGRKRLNILGAYSPDDHDDVDLRLTKENTAPRSPSLAATGTDPTPGCSTFAAREGRSGADAGGPGRAGPPDVATEA